MAQKNATIVTTFTSRPVSSEPLFTSAAVGAVIIGANSVLATGIGI